MVGAALLPLRSVGLLPVSRYSGWLLRYQRGVTWFLVWPMFSWWLIETGIQR